MRMKHMTRGTFVYKATSAGHNLTTRGGSESHLRERSVTKFIIQQRIRLSREIDNGSDGSDGSDGSEQRERTRRVKSSEPDGKLLPADLTHYVVPDVGVVLDYLEILELRELQGVVFTQTACQALQHSKGRRQYNRLRNLLKDPRHDCVLFANEFQEYSYCPREKGESQDTWQSR
ncbi:hypothetical protein F2P81_025435 [Scophthalmus maximus]|uniref:Uncharacterized protein n=1 Tax=Scophthalmus maximus TaxID=52904 RepID=A0A6A4RPX9_SCOMX|nr:hypothetical protein F2P81_025435 [Scophthalmus maximus]